MKKPYIAIACGGTGGHLFPGLAVANELARRACDVALLVSPKEVDQRAVKNAAGMEVLTLPGVGFQTGSKLAFFNGLRKSYRAAGSLFRSRLPDAVLGMGGFASAGPLLAARRLGTQTFLHESNTVPGRANRLLSWVVGRAFVGFPSAASRLKKRVTVTGTPVRLCIRPEKEGECRKELGLEPELPVVLVVGGSQGASGLNELIIRALPLLAKMAPEWQWFHITGAADEEKVRNAYEAAKLRAVVRPFFAEMELALGAATAAVSRAGASSLAELAAMRVPAVLVPYPTATDNHQFHNATAFVLTGAARMLEQGTATPELVALCLLDIVGNRNVREQMRRALVLWQSPRAAEEIANEILRSIETPERAGAWAVPGTASSDAEHAMKNPEGCEAGAGCCSRDGPHSGQTSVQEGVVA